MVVILLSVLCLSSSLCLNVSHHVPDEVWFTNSHAEGSETVDIKPASQVSEIERVVAPLQIHFSNTASLRDERVKRKETEKIESREEVR